MNRTNIDWPGLDYTWNPVVGCKRQCPWCYARRINDRFYGVPFEEMRFFPERLNEPMRTKKPSKIFVGSMSDPEYWTEEQWSAILETCEFCRWHTFMFLSKGKPYHRAIPDNCICGVTLTCEGDFHDQLSRMDEYMTDGKRRRFISIEPLLGELRLSESFFNGVELIIAGAMTGPKAIKPEPAWIESVKRIVPKEKLHVKKNMRDYWERLVL